MNTVSGSAAARTTVLVVVAAVVVVGGRKKAVFAKVILWQRLVSQTPVQVMIHVHTHTQRGVGGRPPVLWVTRH